MDLNLTLKPTEITELATFYNVKRTCPNPVVQVIGVEKTKKRHTYKLLLSDGLYFHGAYVDCTLKRSKQLQKGSIVRLTKYLRASVYNTTIIKVLDVNVIDTKDNVIIGNPKPFPYSATSCISAEDDYHGSFPEDKHPLLEGSCSSAEDVSLGSFSEDKHPLLEGSCSSEEDVSLGSFSEDKHPLLEGSCSSAEDVFLGSFPEEEQPLLEGSCSSAEDDSLGSFSEDEQYPLLKGSCSSAEDDSLGSFSEDKHHLLKGSCSSVEEQPELGTETEDGFIMLDNSFDYELL